MLHLVLLTAWRWKKPSGRAMTLVDPTPTTTKRSTKCSLILLKSSHILPLLSLRMHTSTIISHGGHLSTDSSSEHGSIPSSWLLSLKILSSIQRTKALLIYTLSQSVSVPRPMSLLMISTGSTIPTNPQRERPLTAEEREKGTLFKHAYI